VTLEFWYDFSSPFSYLASTQIERVAASAGAALAWRPFLLGGLFKLIGTPNVPLFEMPEPKRAHAILDQVRWADHWGVPFRFPSRFPLNTVTPLRMALCAGEKVAPLTHAVYRALWVDDRDISEPAILADLANSVGLDGPALVARTQEPAVKEELMARTEEAARRGMCGAPSFFVGDLLFWGQDRLVLVEKALRGWRPSAG
jgi:2-hydroxychromene-2-carboxylate isomerase